jgi:hypothetical protein
MGIIFINPSRVPGSPSLERVSAFEEFFSEVGFTCRSIDFSKVTIIDFIFFKNKSGFVFLSMPSFRKWWLFLLPWVKVIFDVRDGWSIAMASGYGGTAKRKPIKAFFASKVERWAIRRSFITITCTPGLRSHLERVSQKEIYLIPNGVSDKDLTLAGHFRNSLGSLKKLPTKGLVKLCCAGKFSEYGEEKVKKIIDVISVRYANAKYVIKLFGCDVDMNKWLEQYVDEVSGGRGQVEIVGRLPKHDLYAQMAECDTGISVIRDPDYDFGTKVYDYIALGLPVLNYFSEPNSFTNYFNAYLDDPFYGQTEERKISRSEQIRTVLTGIFH